MYKKSNTNWYDKHWNVGTKERKSLGSHLYDYLVKYKLDPNIKSLSGIKDCFTLEIGEVYLDLDESWHFSVPKETNFGKGYTLQFKYRKFENTCYKFALVINEEQDENIFGSLYIVNEIKRDKLSKEISKNNYQELFLELAKNLKEVGNIDLYNKTISKYELYKNIKFENLSPQDQMVILQKIGQMNLGKNEIIDKDQWISYIDSIEISDFFTKVVAKIKTYKGTFE